MISDEPIKLVETKIKLNSLLFQNPFAKHFSRITNILIYPIFVSFPYKLF